MSGHDTREQPPILISGGRGYVGSALGAALKARGIPCIMLSRSRGAAHQGIPVMHYDDLDRLDSARGVINLAGANIAGGRWTAARKQELRNSRLLVTRRLSQWCQAKTTPPEFFLSASAIGYYGNTGEHAVTEDDPPGQGFGAQLCQDWENEITLPEQTRQIIMRIGVVIGPGGGALARMLPAFKLGLGGPIGNGQQWMSWIALQDLIGMCLAAIENPDWQGCFNAVAPEPVRNRDFALALGRVLHRPARLPLPGAFLKLALGEMSGLLLDSQRVLPAHLEQQRYIYRLATLDTALAAAVHGQGT